MAYNATFRRLALKVTRPSRTFHSSARAFIKVGDRLPNLDILVEQSPGNKVNLSELVAGKALIIGVPGAFSPACSKSHIPGYINHKKLKDAGDVFVIAVNDPFVVKAWGDSLDPTGESGIRFLGDPRAEFTQALDLSFDGTAVFGGPRSKRYALELENASSDTSNPRLNKRIASAATAPPTPLTNVMDSEDDFMSGMSSDEEDDVLQESDNDDGSGDDFGFDEPEPDLGISQKDITQKKKKSYDINFKVYHPEDIQSQQDILVDEVNMILNIRKEDAAILLRHFRWNKERLIEDYMDKPKKLLEEAGLGPSTSGPPKLEIIHGFMCDICCEDEVGLQSFAMKCGHRYCINCYTHYLSQKIKEEGEAARIQCPQDGCKRIMDAKSLDLLVSTDLRNRYYELLTRTYVEDKEHLKWCPAPDCTNAIECSIKKNQLDKVVPTVICDCKYRFCFGCILADHQPAPCELVKKWLKKCADDSETANWISANTKECPKCNSTIEKNGGCNHMTCRKCKHEFCWMCMGLWSEHGTSWYNCNRFEEKSGSEARDAQAKSRVSLERYLHYYNRYANHEQSAKLDKDIYNKTEKKMIQLQSASGMSWIEVQYLNSASQALQTCRQTLKWTYAFAFYLARNNLTEMFEDNQKDLEMAVEALSEMFEKPVIELADAKLKVEIMDKTTYCNKRRVILLADTADNLANGEWDFAAELKAPITIGRSSLGGSR
ncbi:hypothetical protein B7494_g5852 [Chlorociboria aeruginascens]|nr:hypothetical protein B7494_g5852 [Chlorociboria aeruginascens]